VKEDLVKPFIGWVLLPSFKPVAVNMVAEEYFMGKFFLFSDKDKHYKNDNVYATKTAAIEAGRARLSVDKDKLRSQHEKLLKRLAALDKADSQP
jgi:hypothetical protein